MNIDEYRAMVAQESGDQPAQQKQDTQVQPTDENPNADTPVDKVKVGEEEVSIEELKKGYMRQQDYTKKTQAVAEERRKNERAFEVYETIKDDDELVKKVGEKAIKKGKKEPVSDEVIRLQAELDRVNQEKELGILSAKYPDFNEVEVLEKAKELGVSNLEFVYKGIVADRQKPETFDKEALKAQLREEILAETQISMVGVGGQQVVSQKQEVTLTPAQAKAARAFRMTPEEYMKNRR